MTQNGRPPKLKSWLADVVPPADREPWAIIALVLLVLFLNQYVGFLSQLEFLGSERISEINTGTNGHFYSKIYFSVARVFYYALPALLFARFVMGKSPSELGWRVTFRWDDLRVYVGLYFLILPLVWWASTLETFNNFYPFFRPEGYDPAWRYFLLWEISYLCYFLAFEWFFRGFVLQALRPRFGTMAVALMLIPYVMIHFRKPFLEAIGAIFAGLVLGVLAYRSRNAFGGALLHFAVALTMDLLAVEGL